MRVALIFPGFQSDPSDWCIPVFSNLVRVLAARPGLQVDVFTLRYPHRRDQYVVNGARVHSFGGGAVLGRRVRGASMALLWRQFLAAMRREHRRSPFAVVHGFWATESGYLAVRAARTLQVPSVVHLAGGELTDLPDIRYGNLREPLAGALVRRALDGATAITVPSGPMLRVLREHFPAAEVRSFTWRPGVDCEMFSPADVTREPEGGSLRVAHAASLVPVKDQATLLKAVAIARKRDPDTNIHLSIAGEGPLRSWLEQQARRLGVHDKVTFCGKLPHDRLPRFYQAHDLFALASRHEAQCMAALEAMACGLPWASTPVGSLADAEPTGGGWIFPAGDAEALATIFLTAAHDPAGRLERGRAARRWANANFDMNLAVDELIDLYLKLAGRASGLPAHT